MNTEIIKGITGRHFKTVFFFLPEIIFVPSIDLEN